MIDVKDFEKIVDDAVKEYKRIHGNIKKDIALISSIKPQDINHVEVMKLKGIKTIYFSDHIEPGTVYIALKEDTKDLKKINDKKLNLKSSKYTTHNNMLIARIEEV